MPTKSREQFSDAVTPALESLLTDLQKTTEILRRKHVEQESPPHGTKRRGGSDDFDNIGRELNASYGSGGSPSAKRAGLSSSDGSDSKAAMYNGTGGKFDPDKHGIHTIPKGDCSGCGGEIIGPVVIALGKMWHPEHFSCCHCGSEIGHRNFFERAGKAYCEGDFHDLFSPRCHYCNGPIMERYINAQGRTYHPEHFTCSQCGRPIEDGFFEKDGAHFCRDDFYRNYAPKCHGCKQPITSKYITALDTHWHQECFCCQADDYFANKCPMNVDIYDEVEY